jgi:hypothetical protein
MMVLGTALDDPVVLGLSTVLFGVELVIEWVRLFQETRR